MKIRNILRKTRNAITLGRSSTPYHHHYLAGLLEHEKPTENSSLRGIVPEKYRSAADRYVLQRLLREVRYTELLPSLVDYLASPNIPVTVTLPPALRGVLAKQGVKFTKKSSFGWWGQQIRFAFDGLKCAVGLLTSGLPVAEQILPEKILCNVQKNSLPYDIFDPDNSYDLVSWLWRTEGLEESGVVLWLGGVHPENCPDDSRLHPSTRNLPSLGSWMSWFAFFKDTIQILFLGALRWLFGQNWQPVLWRGAIELAYVNRLAVLPRTVYFTCSDYDLRPLWTYAIPESVVIFYSISSELLWSGQLSPGPAESGFQAMSWSRYMMFDEYQVEWLKEILVPEGADPVAQICGPVDFTDGPADIDHIGPQDVAIFDLTPFRTPRRALMGLYHDCWSSRVCMDFLEDVTEALNHVGLTGVFKAKRVHTKNHNRRYLRLLGKLEDEKKIVLVDPVVAARRLIERCGAVIVMPYSSPGVIASQLNKKVAYYDPEGNLGSYPRLCHGVTVLKGPKELATWISELNLNN